MVNFKDSWAQDTSSVVYSCICGCLGLSHYTPSTRAARCRIISPQCVSCVKPSPSFTLIYLGPSMGLTAWAKSTSCFFQIPLRLIWWCSTEPDCGFLMWRRYHCSKGCGCGDSIWRRLYPNSGYIFLFLLLPIFSIIVLSRYWFRKIL